MKNSAAYMALYKKKLESESILTRFFAILSRLCAHWNNGVERVFHDGSKAQVKKYI